MKKATKNTKAIHAAELQNAVEPTTETIDKAFNDYLKSKKDTAPAVTGKISRISETETGNVFLSVDFTHTDPATGWIKAASLDIFCCRGYADIARELVVGQTVKAQFKPSKEGDLLYCDGLTYRPFPKASRASEKVPADPKTPELSAMNAVV